VEYVVYNICTSKVFYQLTFECFLDGLRQNPACSKSTDAALQFETVKSFVRAAEAARRIATRKILLPELEADHNDEHNAEENR